MEHERLRRAAAVLVLYLVNIAVIYMIQSL